MKIELVPAKNVMEDKNDVKKLFEYVIDHFQKNDPNPRTELKYKNPFELLVAAILSAQCLDRRVNAVTPKLFEVYPTPDKMAKATPDEIYSYISSVTYPGNKSKYLVNTAKILIDKYNGKIPDNEDELQKLPGVGRKTANLLASTLYNKPTLAVDTHVFRVSERIGLTIGAKTPIEVEEQIVRYTPKDVISKMSHWLILHGRYICVARNPQCHICGINKVCRYFSTNVRRVDKSHG